MELEGIEASQAKTGTIALVFGNIVWTADAKLIATLQTEGIVGKLKYTPRALNTKVLALPWIVPSKPEMASAQRKALEAHAELREARGFAIPELAKFYFDDDDAPTPYMDGGELTVAMARCAPDKLADAMPYLRAPQRPDWFMDALAAVAEKTKAARDRAAIYDAIASMPIPSRSNKHWKTYVACVSEGAAAFRAAKDAPNAMRLEQKAAMFAKKK